MSSFSPQLLVSKAGYQPVTVDADAALTRTNYDFELVRQ
jgi:hypothetical protein